jgi:hypothetical protein
VSFRSFRKLPSLIGGFPRPAYGHASDFKPCTRISPKVNNRAGLGLGRQEGVNVQFTAPTDLVSPNFRSTLALQARVSNSVVGRFEANSSGDSGLHSRSANAKWFRIRESCVRTSWCLRKRMFKLRETKSWETISRIVHAKKDGRGRGHVAKTLRSRAVLHGKRS